MSDMHETARRLYKAALAIKGLSRPSDVAKAMGESPQTLKNWESRGVSYKGRMTAMTTIGVNPAFIEHGEGGMETQGFLPRLAANLPNVTELDPQRIRVPLISWIQAGELSDVVDLFHPGEAVQWEDALKSNPSKHAYALMVEGDSMVSQTGVHSFPAGTILIVDPDRGANAGDFVIAKDVQTQKATFKQLTTDGARWYLKPLNTQYPTIEIDDPAMRVIGRVIEAKPPSVKL